MAELIEFHKVPLNSADDHYIDRRHEELGLVPPLSAIMTKPHELEEILRSRVTVKPIVRIKRPRNRLNPGQQSVPSSVLNAAPPTAVESTGQAVLPELKGVIEPPKTSNELESVVERSTFCDLEGIPVLPNLCEDLEGIASLCDDLEGIAEVVPPPNPKFMLPAQTPRPKPFWIKLTARKSTKTTAIVGQNNKKPEVKPCSVRVVDLKNTRPKRLKKLLRQYYAYTSKNTKSCHKPTPKDCSEIKLVIKKVSRKDSSDSGHITDELDDLAPPPPSVQDVLRKISVWGTHPHPPHLTNGSSSKPGTDFGSPGTATLYASFVAQSDANPPQKRARAGMERDGGSEAVKTPDKKVNGSDDPQSLSPPAKKKAVKCEPYSSAVSPQNDEPDSTPPQNVPHSRKRIVFGELQVTAPSPLRLESQTFPRPPKKEDEPPPTARKRIKPFHVHPDFLKKITTRGGYLSTFSDRTDSFTFSDKAVALPTDAIFTFDLDNKLKKTHQVQVVSSKSQKEVFLRRIERYDI